MYTSGRKQYLKKALVNECFLYTKIKFCELPDLSGNNTCQLLQGIFRYNAGAVLC